MYGINGDGGVVQSRCISSKYVNFKNKNFPDNMSVKRRTPLKILLHKYNIKTFVLKNTHCFTYDF